MAEAGRIEINLVRCKGCGLCIAACPKDLLDFSSELNDRGYNYVVLDGDPEQCTGCGLCIPTALQNCNVLDLGCGPGGA